MRRTQKNELQTGTPQGVSVSAYRKSARQEASAAKAPRRRTLWRAGKAVCFALGALLLWQTCATVFTVLGSSEDSADERASLFFKLPRDTVDVMFLGSSHAFCSFVPQQLYDDAGVTSAMAASSAQSIESSYYLLKEALVRQTPQVAVLELYNIAAEAHPETRWLALHYYSGIRLLPDVSAAKVQQYAGLKQWPEIADLSVYQVSQLLLHRSGWKQLFSADALRSAVSYAVRPADAFETFGYHSEVASAPFTSLAADFTPTGEPVVLADTRDYAYLEKIAALCEENGITLLCVLAPFRQTVDDGTLYAQAVQWAAQKGIACYDVRDGAAAGIDPATDLLADGEHLNYSGAQKFTRWFTQVLAQTHPLPDHRGEARYALWERRAFDYTQVTPVMAEE